MNKVTSALLFDLGFVERNSTAANAGPNAREIVKTSNLNDAIILPGSIDEVVARFNADGITLPVFIENMMGFAAVIEARNVTNELTARFNRSVALASALLADSVR